MYVYACIFIYVYHKNMCIYIYGCSIYIIYILICFIMYNGY